MKTALTKKNTTDSKYPHSPSFSRLIPLFLSLTLISAFILPITAYGQARVNKSVRIENVTGLTGKAVVWLFAELPSGGNEPTNTAIKTGTISKGILSINLVVPKDDTIETNQRWTGTGNFYVALVPIIDIYYDTSSARIFTNGENAPVKVPFAEALTTLDYSKFSVWGKQVKIENINGLTGQVGVWIFAELPSGGNVPTNTAIRRDTISRGILSVGLIEPRDNTWAAGSPWAGTGNFYVALVPYNGRSYDFSKARIFTDGGNAPVKVPITEALTTLDYSKFSVWGKQVNIENITDLTGSGYAGVWLFPDLPSGVNWPTNTAIQWGTISRGILSVNLVEPRDNTWNTGPRWTGGGNFYVVLIPPNSNYVNLYDARIFTDGGNAPVKVRFTEGFTTTTLDYSKFSVWGKQVKIENITGLSGEVGVWIFAELPSGGNEPTNTAIRWGNVSRRTLSVNLVVPRDNTWWGAGSAGSPWAGTGNYYVALVPTRRNGYDFANARIFTNGTDAPVRVPFTEALTTLDFSKFSAWK